MRNQKLLAAVLIAVLIAVMGPGGPALGKDRPWLRHIENIKLPRLSPELADGKVAYDLFCAQCHGENLVGTLKRGPTFLHRVYHPGHHRDEGFVRASKEGARQHHWKFGEMRPIFGITKERVKIIVKYIRRVQRENGLF